MRELKYLKNSQRISKLGDLGEELAAEALRNSGFYDVQNLNEVRRNYPFADLLAQRGGNHYFIGVKARNESRSDGKLNESYNLVLISDLKNRELKKHGKTVTDITNLLLVEARELASEHNATPAWITVPVRPEKGMFASFFGLLDEIGIRRSVPMTMSARKNYECIADWQHDQRIVPELLNR